MKKATFLLSAALLLLLPPTTLAQTGQQQHQQSIIFTNVASPEVKPPLRLLTTLQVSDTLTGLRVRINADAPLSDYVSYRSGDRFIVVLPQTQAAAVQSEVNRGGLIDLQVEQRATT